MQAAHFVCLVGAEEKLAGDWGALFRVRVVRQPSRFSGATDVEGGSGVPEEPARVEWPVGALAMDGFKPASVQVTKWIVEACEVRKVITSMQEPRFLRLSRAQQNRKR